MKTGAMNAALRGGLAAALLAAGYGVATAAEQAQEERTHMVNVTHNFDPPQVRPEMTVRWWDTEREPINRLNEFGILERWLLVGAFPNRPLPSSATPAACTREGYEMDSLLSLGGEANAVLTLDTSVPCVLPGEHQALTVLPASARLNGRFDFRRFYSETDDRVAYVFCYVDHDRDEVVECDFGSDDSAKVWVNGALVHQIWTPGRGCVPGSEHFQMPLRRGRNRVLIKVENYRGNWEFFLAAYPAALKATVKRNLTLFTSMQGHPPAEGVSRQPFIDPLGQYKHADWPGKTHGLEELSANREAEAAALARDQGPRDWNLYGGWQTGPTLAASGFFRTERYQGKWWLVDPLGKLFFSHGLDCVNTGESTGLDDRENWFEALPSAAGELAVCYGTQQGGHNYYAGKTTRTFDFARANLIRKYDPEWRERFADTVHARLRRWGINTIANWSDQSIYVKRRTPYTVFLQRGGPKLAGSKGTWAPFTDVFDPEFRKSLEERMRRELGASAGDPWCIGYFMDNELDWGEPDDLALAALCSPPEQAAKKEFLGRLRARYETIERLNQAWGTAHDSWQALAAHRDAPDRRRAADDLLSFSREFAEAYFRTCREVIKEAVPHQLYLGCRFAHTHPNHAMPAALAAKYCDVVSYNIYEVELGKVVFPDPSDVPIMIGEFHFGALDRGLFHTGLKQVANQKERAATYIRYVTNALAHPQIVGCHWFQFRDSPTSGRVYDGENYQIGFVDVCDTPYRETVAAARTVGDNLYRTRLNPAATKP